MKACPHCQAPMADAANRCPECGLREGEVVVRDLRTVDTVLGENKSNNLVPAVIVAGLLLVATLVWMSY